MEIDVHAAIMKLVIDWTRSTNFKRRSQSYYNLARDLIRQNYLIEPEDNAMWRSFTGPTGLQPGWDEYKKSSEYTQATRAYRDAEEAIAHKAMSLVAGRQGA